MNLTIPFQFSILSKKHRLILCLLILVSGIADTMAQPVTGVWRGRIIRGSGLRQQSAPIEIKFVAQGDSIVGTSYYYGSGKSYVRYSIKGHFGMEYNTVVWKDYHMVEMYPEKPKEAKAFAETMKIEADYSCPDGRTLRLDGIGRLPGQPEMKIELRKMENTFFPDEWDDVIDGYFTGMARKEVVDSVWSIASEPYRPRGAAARASDDIAAAPAKAPDRDNTSITARPATEVKASPARPAPAATVVTEMQPDTLAIAKAEPPTVPMVSGVNGPEKKVDSTMVARAIMPPPKAERLVEKVGDTITAPTSTAAVSRTTAANTPPPNNTAATASSSTAPVAAPPRPAPRPAAPQDVTAIIAEQQRRQAAANPTPAPPLEKPPAETAKAVPQPAAPVTTPANTTTSTTSVSTTPRPGTAVVVDPDKPIDNPVMRSAYTARRKVVQTELPILGDTIELRFYDNAEIDGDSISLFLNDVALFQHVRLDARPYIFKLPVNELPENSELTMVAENLGAIPPNTAFMEAFVQGRRYSARLESTEQTSAVIRLVKKE